MIKALHENVNMDDGPRENRQGPSRAQPAPPIWVLPAVPPGHLLDSLMGRMGSKEPMSPSSKVPNLCWSTWPWSEWESKLQAWYNEPLGPSLSMEYNVSTTCPANQIITTLVSPRSLWSTLLLVLWIEETLSDVRRINSVTCNTWILKAGRIYEVLKQCLGDLPVISSVFRLRSHSPVRRPLKWDDLTPAAPRLPLRRHSKAGNRVLSLFDHLQQQKRLKVRVLSQNHQRTLPAKSARYTSNRQSNIWD